MPYTDEEKANALALFEKYGACEAARRTGIERSNLSHMAKAAGVKSKVKDILKETHETNKVLFDERKSQLAQGLLDDAERLREQLFAPITVYKFGGNKNEFATAEVDEPSPSDKVKLMTSLAIAVDKIQLLTGEATSRNETITESREAIESRIAALDEVAEQRLKRLA